MDDLLWRAAAAPDVEADFAPEEATAVVEAEAEKAAPVAPAAPWPPLGPRPSVSVQWPGSPESEGQWAWGPRPGACVSRPASPRPASPRLASPCFALPRPILDVGHTALGSPYFILFN